MSEYKPIDCGTYDQLEAAIVQRRLVKLVYRDDQQQEVELHTHLLDLRTQEGEEWVQLPELGWLRLDRLVSIDY